MNTSADISPRNFSRRRLNKGQSSNSIVTRHSAARLAIAAKVITGFGAALLLLVPVLILFLVSMSRLMIAGTVVVSMLVCTTAVSIVTTARVQDVMIITAGLVCTDYHRILPLTWEQIWSSDCGSLGEHEPRDQRA